MSRLGRRGSTPFWKEQQFIIPQLDVGNLVIDKNVDASDFCIDESTFEKKEAISCQYGNYMYAYMTCKSGSHIKINSATYGRPEYTVPNPCK